MRTKLHFNKPKVFKLKSYTLDTHVISAKNLKIKEISTKPSYFINLKKYTITL